MMKTPKHILMWFNFNVDNFYFSLSYSIGFYNFMAGLKILLISLCPLWKLTSWPSISQISLLWNCQSPIYSSLSVVDQ